MSSKFIKSSDFPLRTEVRSFQVGGGEDYELGKYRPSNGTIVISTNLT